MAGPTTSASLQLTAALLRARTATAAAEVLVERLQDGEGGHPWWVLAVTADTMAEVVAGSGQGRRVRLDLAGGDLRGRVPDLGANLGDEATLLAPVTTPSGTWGAVVGPHDDESAVQAAADILAAAVGALQREAELSEAVDRLEEAQAVAHMGSYDWNIATDANRWSDQLYRVYGYEPQSFNASYERFLSMLHPDDRERIEAIHRKAYATGEPYHMVERIVRPDGEVRVLDSTGRVIVDDTGTPVRMAGVCIDITERWRSEHLAAQVAERFLLLVETAPDALVVVGHDGLVTQVNPRALELFAATTEELVGAPVTSVLPDGLPEPDPEGTRERHGVPALRADGSGLLVDVTAGVIEDDDGVVVVAFVRDATRRLAEERQRQQLREAEQRRRQALEINDNVLQGLAAVLYTLEQGAADAAALVAARTLDAARAMVDELLAGSDGGGIVPGSLVRDRAAPAADMRPPRVPTSSAHARPVAAPAGTASPVRVVIVDDAADLQLVLRLTLEGDGGFSVVGTAGDGRTAIERCQQLQPDLVLLDLSMPVMDGLQALPHLRACAPNATVVVLSGFDASTARDEALERGAAAYLEKGLPQRELVARLREMTGAPPPAVQPLDRDHAWTGEVEDLVDHLVHELTTPLTAIEGLAETLIERGDQLTSATSTEVLASLHRNARTMTALMRRVVQAREAADGETITDPEPVDVAGIVRETVRDFAGVAGGDRLVVEADPDVAGPIRPEVEVEADMVHVRQILTNLFSNALKYSPPDHPVVVTVRQTPDSVQVEVADRGSGVPDGVRHDVFDRFVRGAAGVPGLGLGLYLSRTLARANGGDVTLVTSGPSGSTFRLSLPTTAAVPAPPRERRPRR